MSDKKENYMALEDFQTLWSNKIKPAIPTATKSIASQAVCKAIIDELT